MLTVLISDDEPDVCQLIAHLIDWPAMGLELAGIAVNGLDCLDKIKRFRPDIVITDIRMPGLDGLNLIRQVHENGLRPYFIIISGYRHFQYAQQAIRYEVEDYLLKPIGKAELTYCLENIVRKIRANQEKACAAEEKELLFKESRQRLQGHLVTVLLHRPGACGSMDIRSLNETFHTAFQEGEFLAVCMQASGAKGVTEEELASVLKYAENTAIRMLAEQRLKNVLAVDGFRLFGIVNCNAGEGAAARMALGTAYRTALAYIKDRKDIALSCAISRGGKEPEEFTRMLKEAGEGVDYQLVWDPGRAVDMEQVSGSSMDMEEICPLPVKRDIENTAAALDIDKMCRGVDLVFREFRKWEAGNPRMLFEFCRYLEDAIRKSLENSKICEKIPPGILCSGGVSDLTEMNRSVKEQIGELFGHLIQESESNGNRSVRTAKQYISEHFMKPVRLSEVAELVHMNAAYFSTVFKKETGESFSDYVTGQRMEAAKRFLRGSDLPISVIAEKVGYTETAYFSRLFTKVVGIKPSQYRNLHS
ncbi:response regulator transcription factor [Qiania dongpingensis]|uniref:Stage 0 sporulation protein A homolog n=1 Tax=Qiania dongpingensis TaxID=2763669 RepID=A0A7G9G1G4_9FIRM|nr:response regulator [Qiania dongpingensis]QNM04646.1 response regulator [Qiania dongpingensis]